MGRANRTLRIELLNPKTRIDMNSPAAMLRNDTEFPNLRTWLRELAATDRLAVARSGISLTDELAAVAKKLELERAVLFPSPEGHDIAVAPICSPTAAGSRIPSASPSRIFCSRFQQAVRHPLPWTEVEEAPVQAEIHREVDLLKLLPIPKHNEHDSGPYITAALLIARNPKTGMQNVSIHRCQVSGPNRIGVLLLPRHTRHYFTTWRRSRRAARDRARHRRRSA